MFDIVSKNKKLAFLVSFIKDTVSSCHEYNQLLDIQKKSSFIQTNIQHCKRKRLPPFFPSKHSIQSARSQHTKTKKSHTINNVQSTCQTSLRPTSLRPTSIRPTSIRPTLPQKKSIKNTYTIEQDTLILHEHYSTDFLIVGFLLCIDSNFIQTAYSLQLEYIKTLKYKIALELDTRNLYKQFGYNKVRSLKKTVLQTSLFNDKDIHYHHLYRYIGDYFNVNFITIIDTIFIQYYNEYKDNRINIIIYKDEDQYSIDTSTRMDEYIYNNTVDLSQYIKYPGQTFKDYNKLKLTDIQTIATRKKIPVRLFAKNKTKKMLIEEILQL
jgi:hypothetical protein